MVDTPNLKLPFIASDQAQKHITHNLSLNTLDALVQPTVINASTNAPPGSTTVGDAYVVGSTPTGDWSGKAYQIAVWQDAAWSFYVPADGWTVYNRATNVHIVFDGAIWAAITATPSVLSLNRVTVSGTTLNLDDTHLVGNVELLCTNAAGCAITIPDTLVGTEPVLVSQEGAAQVTIVAGGATVLHSADGKLKTRVQYSTLIIDPRGSDVYNIAGDIAA